MSQVVFGVSRSLLRGFVGKRLTKSNILLIARSFHLGIPSTMRFINQVDAIAIDQDLFNTCKFGVSQLMELAGLGCANAIYKCYPVDLYRSVLVLCGPGNNGGDGLVCARHLKQFGFKPEVYYPKRNLATYFNDLVVQCQASNIYICDKMPDLNRYSVVIDALFGFSYKPPTRAEFQPILEQLSTTKTEICSIDIPSGWDVNTGRIEGVPSFSPDMLISLTAPKKCASKFTGRFHFLTGRFVPQKLDDLYNLGLPVYPGTESCIDITGWKDLPNL